MCAESRKRHIVRGYIRELLPIPINKTVWMRYGNYRELRTQWKLTIRVFLFACVFLHKACLSTRCLFCLVITHYLFSVKVLKKICLPEVFMIPTVDVCILLPHRHSEIVHFTQRRDAGIFKFGTNVCEERKFARRDW